MSTGQILGYCLIPAALLLAAWVIRTGCLWSEVANTTVPWFCTVLAFAQLVVGLVCVSTNRSAAELPLAIPIAVTGLCTGGLLIGVMVDARWYFGKQGLSVNLIEVLGFGAMLAILFWLPRLT